MHQHYSKAHTLSSKVIDAGIKVHRHKGPGLIESIYERCLLHVLRLQSISAVSQLVVPCEYKRLVFGEPLRLDVYVDDCLIVEKKLVEKSCQSTKLSYVLT